MLYEKEGTQSFGTISDVKSHKADATWASLAKIFTHIDFSDCNHLYVVSDSPTSQYRNKKNVLLMKDWAVSNKVEFTWVYTESGHGKGPMDGVGSGIKRAVKDTISYRPNDVIRDTTQLMEHLPELNNIIIDTYNEEDVLKARQGFGQENVNSLKIISNGIGISNVHEIYCDINDEKKCQWKALSEDKEFIKAHWQKVTTRR